MPSLEGLPEALRNLCEREPKRRSFRQIAEDAGLGNSLLSTWFSGRHAPSMSGLERLLDTIGATLEELGREVATIQGHAPRVAPADAEVDAIDVREILATAKERFGEAVEYLMMAAEQGRGSGDHSSAARQAVERVAPSKKGKEKGR